MTGPSIINSIGPGLTMSPNAALLLQQACGFYMAVFFCNCLGSNFGALAFFSRFLFSNYNTLKLDELEVGRFILRGYSLEAS